MPYPDNMPAARKSTADFRCKNEDCAQKSWEVDGMVDCGAWFADNEDDTICPSCGQEGE